MRVYNPLLTLMAAACMGVMSLAMATETTQSPVTAQASDSLQTPELANQTAITTPSAHGVESTFRITVNGIFPESDYERLFNSNLANAPTYGALDLEDAVDPLGAIVRQATPTSASAQLGLKADGKTGLSGTPTHAKRGRSYVVRGVRYTPFAEISEFTEVGTASWYGPGFHGRKTANGERFDQYALTAAHKELPLNSVVRVSHEGTGKSVVVRINDRGPFIGDRVIDLSYAAAKEIGMIKQGKAKVKIELLPEEPKHRL